MPAQYFRPSHDLNAAPMSPIWRPYLSTETYKRGALVQTNADGLVIECTDADFISSVTGKVLGIANEAVNSRPGDLVANGAVIINTIQHMVPVFLASAGTLFIGSGVNGATDPVVPLATHVGEEYNVIRDANGIWRIDFAETAEKIVHIEKIDTDINCFFFRFIPAVVEA